MCPLILSGNCNYWEVFKLMVLDVFSQKCKFQLRGQRLLFFNFEMFYAFLSTYGF